MMQSDYIIFWPFKCAVVGSHLSSRKEKCCDT